MTLPVVWTSASPEEGAVHRHQTEFVAEFGFGSPVSTVASTLEPVAVTGEAFPRSIRLAKASLGGAAAMAEEVRAMQNPEMIHRFAVGRLCLRVLGGQSERRQILVLRMGK